MTELNTMLREHALTGLQSQLDAAVTNGDTAAARKITDDIAKLAVSTAPKAPAFGGPDVYAQLEIKAPWYGVDPKKSAKAEELGKAMKLNKFPTAEAFADALIKAVDEEFKVTPAAGVSEGGEDDEDPKDDEDEAGEDGKKPVTKRRTDGPGEGEAAGRAVRSKSGPWTKMSDAPGDVQKDVKRAADKFAPKTKEGRAAFEAKALEAHYAQHQRNKPGKK